MTIQGVLMTGTNPDFDVAHIRQACLQADIALIAQVSRDNDLLNGLHNHDWIPEPKIVLISNTASNNLRNLINAAQGKNNALEFILITTPKTDTATIVKALGHGAVGYVRDDIPPGTLQKIAQCVCSQQAVLEPEIAKAIGTIYTPTLRQQTLVLNGLAQGELAAAIITQLQMEVQSPAEQSLIDETTMLSHTYNLLKKFQDAPITNRQFESLRKDASGHP